MAQYPWCPLSNEIEAYVDADHAGCFRTRKSTLGGTLMWNRRFIKGWSKTMDILALSSGESELAAVVKGATEALGLQSILKDFGVNTTLHLLSDATAAIGIVCRLGLGRVRHLATADLWIQQRLRCGGVKVSKWPGTDNPADLMTKYQPRTVTSFFRMVRANSSGVRPGPA